MSIIRRRLDAEPGIEELRFEVVRGKLTAAFDPQTLTAEEIAAQVSALGLECRPWEEPPRETPFFERRGRDLLTAVSGSALTLAFAIQALGSGDWPAAIAHQYEGALPAALVCFLAAMASGAALVVPKGRKSLAEGRPDMNALVLVSLVGANIALESAEVALMSPRLELLPDLVRTGRFCLRVIRQNVAIALGFKLVFLVLAAQNMATLWPEVAADMGATLVVIFNGLRLLHNPKSGAG